MWCVCLCFLLLFLILYIDMYFTKCSNVSVISLLLDLTVQLRSNDVLICKMLEFTLLYITLKPSFKNQLNRIRLINIITYFNHMLSLKRFLFNSSLAIALTMSWMLWIGGFPGMVEMIIALNLFKFVVVMALWWNGKTDESSNWNQTALWSLRSAFIEVASAVEIFFTIAKSRVEALL